jgi:hypothetical protein
MGANPAKFFPWPTPYGQSPDANVLAEAKAAPQAPTQTQPTFLPLNPAPPTPQPPTTPPPPQPQPQPVFNYNRGILNRYRRVADDGEGVDYSPARRARDLME